LQLFVRDSGRSRTREPYQPSADQLIIRRIENNAEPTALLRSWRAGDRTSLDRLLPLLYQELARVARRAMGGERAGHTLQTRALVHEAYMRLIDADVTYQDRAHFLAIAARTMRQVLVDHARARGRDKRGGDAVRVDIDDISVATPALSFDVIALHEALDRLSAVDGRKAQIVEMHFFGGLNQEEAAAALGVSLRTVERELRVAKALLRHDLEAGLS
jgi:RNA polymerase sigma-70 factor, ECF subfamily